MHIWCRCKIYSIHILFNFYIFALECLEACIPGDSINNNKKLLFYLKAKAHIHKTCNKKEKKKKPFQFYADSFIISYTIFQHLTPYTYFGLVISGFVTNLSLPFFFLFLPAPSTQLVCALAEWKQKERRSREKKIYNLKKMKKIET